MRPEPGRKPTILVVDDSPEICDLLQLHLEIAGYDVLLAADGTGAIELIREAKPALAIVDLNMPHVSGDEFVASLKSDPATRDIPVILVSSDEDLADHAKLLGATAYLAKPVSADRLLEIITRHIR